MENMKITAFGDTAAAIILAEEISERARGRVMQLTQHMQGINGVMEVCPTYCGVTVHYDPERIGLTELEEALTGIAFHEQERIVGNVVVIPVCYEGEYAPDLTELARHCGMSISEVVDIHTGRDYPVYMLGFTPGFPYLGGMDSRIAMPRLKTPRVKIPGGSVGIAGEQTGIYPFDSPGGWRIIGRTPLRLFTPEEESITLLRAGDSVRFQSITTTEYERIIRNA